MAHVPMWFSVTLTMNFVGSDEGKRCLHRTDEIIQRSSSSPSASESIDSLPMLRGDKVALCVALMRGGIERVKISRPVHESNRGHGGGEVKQAGPAIRGGEQSRRVSTISGHVLWKPLRAGRLGRPLAGKGGYLGPLRPPVGDGVCRQ